MTKPKKTRTPAKWPPATPLDRGKLLWIYSYAREAFRRVIAAVDYIEKNNIDSDAPIFMPIVTSVYANYCKPFGASHGAGRLPDDFVEDEDRKLHEEIQFHRHKYACHRDTESHSLVVPGDMNQVQIIVYYEHGKKFHRQGVTVIKPLLPQLLEIKRLAEKHDKKCSYPITRELDALEAHVPTPPGRYTLNIVDDTKPLFVPFNPNPDPQLRM